MLTDVLTQIFDRDLDKLKAEVEAYVDENDLWLLSGDISNSAGNLTLHLIGNLKHFFGAVLGETGFVRERDLEFSSDGVPREDLVAGIDEAANVVRKTLAGLSVDDLASEYPTNVFGGPMTTEFFIVHLATHLNYHLGQVNYHRRLLAS
ncbi:MAG: DinB family protein [Acidobacteriota bacterium]